MGSRTLGTQPQARLLHHVSGEIRGTTSIRQFASFPILEARPESGQRTATTACPYCGSGVALRLGSVDATRWRRIAWLLLAALGPIGLPVLVANFGAGETSVPGGLVALALFGLVAATVGGLVMWWKEDGVKLVDPPTVLLPGTRPVTFSSGRDEHLIGFPVVGQRVYTKR
jgi:hypothetical protein